MHKKIAAILLSLLLLLSAALPVFADEVEMPQTRKVTILNLKSFEKLAENCRLDSFSRNLVVSLETDLDLEGLLTLARLVHLLTLSLILQH